MSEFKLKSLRYYPDSDIGKWIEKQDNFAVSMRLIIKSFIRANGYVDVQDAIANPELFSNVKADNDNAFHENTVNKPALNDKNQRNDNDSVNETEHDDNAGETTNKEDKPATKQHENKSDSGYIDISMLTNVMDQ